MLSLRRIVRDYCDAGALNTLLAPWGFVDDQVFLTKAGDLGIVYEVSGTDFECLDRDERRDVVHRCEAAVRLLDERCRLYQYLRKRRLTDLAQPTCENAVARRAIRARHDHLNVRRDDLYDVDLHFVLLYEGGVTGARPDVRDLWRAPRQALRTALISAQASCLLASRLDEAVRMLYQQAEAFEIQLSDTVRPIRLGQSAAFHFLRSLVNYDTRSRTATPLACDAHIDYFMADSSVECHRAHLDVGDVHVKVLTLKEPPVATFPLVLEPLYTVPGEFIACLEWQRLPVERVRRDLHMRRRHHFNRRISLVNYISTEAKPEEMLVDESAGAMVRQLGDALTELEVEGHIFGEFSLTVVLFDQDLSSLDHNVAEATKVLTAADGAVTAERYNLLNAWLAVMPGNRAHNLRRMAVLETNIADLSFLFALDRGSPTCPHLHREALAVFETQHQTLYHLALHVDDVAHTVVLGATGSGKSFLLNFLLIHAQRYEPRTVVFDLGRGYQKLAALLEGTYLPLDLQQTRVRINPFVLPPTPENLHFLSSFVRVLLEGRDRYRLSDPEEREVYDAVESLYVLAPEQRRLFSLANLLPRTLAQRLAKWVEGGRYGTLFDHADDTLALATFQVFDLNAMEAFPELLEPLLFYVLHRVNSHVCDPSQVGVLKLVVMDEAWRFIRHERLRAYVQEALKTWRKHNAAMLLATQSIQDFASADLVRTVIESCPNKLLLANPGFDPEEYRRLFHLNATELALLRDLIPRRQVLLKRPTVAKVLNLNVDPRSYALYTNTPMENERLEALISDYGFEAALDRFAASA